MPSNEAKRLKSIETWHKKYTAPGVSIENVFNGTKKNRPFGLATQFQKLIRIANADSQGFVECISCQRRRKWNEADAGHFQKRRHKILIIEPDNVWPQCKYCNQHLSGNDGEYRKALVDKLGVERVEEMEAMAKRGLPPNHTWNRYELALRRVDIVEEIKSHEERLGI